MASETVLPQLAGVAKSKKARTGSVNPRPHTIAPKSGVGTLELGQPQSAKFRSNPATVPLAPTALGKSQEKRATASAPSPEAETNKTKKTKKQVIKETMHGQKDIGVTAVCLVAVRQLPS